MKPRLSRNLLRRRELVADILLKGRERRRARRVATPAVTAVAARDEAVTRVAANSKGFHPTALAIVSGMGAWTGTGEDLRKIVSLQVEPHHHNAWGALILDAARKGLISRTGERRRMGERSSHARETDVWTRNLGVH